RAKFTNYNDERVPTIFKLGASYSFSEKILATLETEKDINYKPLLRGGIEYKIIKEAYARIGYSTNPGSVNAENSNNSSLYTFGFGIYLKKLNIDFASSVHQILGYSLQVSVIYNF
ncbi:MAG: hypothetical protein K8R58_05920, partial [Bacteroidales bacterium]|nr:hypothetical protein [Bacteroidales bacterium]